MRIQPREIRSGIALFEGKISRNLMSEPMVSHSYLLEDNDIIILFDPSCGRKLRNRIEAYIKYRIECGKRWKKCYFIAGHSHMDHANNFRISEVVDAQEKHIFLHEYGFMNKAVLNRPSDLIEKEVTRGMKYYNYYRSFPMPYHLLMMPVAALNSLSPKLAVKLFSMVGGIPWPKPVNGSTMPVPLKQEQIKIFDFKGIKVDGWPIDGKKILYTPGHSRDSVSLYWPEKKSMFISDADWIGNPVFVSSSLRDSLSSLELMKKLTKSGMIELLLPAHGLVKEGRENILLHLNLRIDLLKNIREEILTLHHALGEEKNIHELAKKLIQKSPLFKLLHLATYPRLVVVLHNIIVVCLKEEGVIGLHSS